MGLCYHSTEMSRSHLEGDADTAAAPTSASSGDTWMGESKDSSLTGRGRLQTYKQEKTRPLFLML